MDHLVLDNLLTIGFDRHYSYNGIFVGNYSGSDDRIYPGNTAKYRDHFYMYFNEEANLINAILNGNDVIDVFINSSCNLVFKFVRLLRIGDNESFLSQYIWILHASEKINDKICYVYKICSKDKELKIVNRSTNENGIQTYTVELNRDGKINGAEINNEYEFSQSRLGSIIFGRMTKSANKR